MPGKPKPAQVLSLEVPRRLSCYLLPLSSTCLSPHTAQLPGRSASPKCLLTPRSEALACRRCSSLPCPWTVPLFPSKPTKTHCLPKLPDLTGCFLLQHNRVSPSDPVFVSHIWPDATYSLEWSCLSSLCLNFCICKIEVQIAPEQHHYESKRKLVVPIT